MAPALHSAEHPRPALLGFSVQLSSLASDLWTLPAWESLDSSSVSSAPGGSRLCLDPLPLYHSLGALSGHARDNCRAHLFVPMSQGSVIHCLLPSVLRTVISWIPSISLLLFQAGRKVWPLLLHFGWKWKCSPVFLSCKSAQAILCTPSSEGAHDLGLITKRANPVLGTILSSTYVESFHLYNCMREALFLLSFCRCRHWRSERLNNLLRCT